LSFVYAGGPGTGTGKKIFGGGFADVGAGGDATPNTGGSSPRTGYRASGLSKQDNSGGGPVGTPWADRRARQGLTLVYFSAQLERF
jgi:hypothetical protein